MILENAVAANVRIMGTLADTGLWGLVSEPNFVFC